MTQRKTTQIFAHRGSKGTHPENTLSAFREALEVGSDGIELDVHLTRDGIPVVIHDETVDRTTDGTGLVQTKTLQELKQLDAGSWFRPPFQGERIPSLAEVLQLLVQCSFTGCLNIELKTDQLQYAGIEERVWDTVLENPGQFEIVFSSFHYPTLETLKRLHPEAEIALLFSQPGQSFAEIGDALSVEGWHPRITLFKRDVKKENTGISVRYWTVNGLPELFLCFWCKVDAIITDYPARAKRLRKMMQGG